MPVTTFWSTSPKAMREAEGTALPFVPAGNDLGRLAVAVQDCRGCELYREATQGGVRVR